MRNKHILIVDDDERVRLSYTLILNPSPSKTERLQRLMGKVVATKKLGFELSCASQGKEGHALAEQAMATGEPFAVAFVDMRMPPGWDGLETARALRKLDNRIYIVIVTAYADCTVDALQNAVGHNILLVRKPFSEDEIFQLARHLCQSWNRDEELRLVNHSLRNIVDALPLALLVIRLNTQAGNIAIANRHFQKLFGFHPEGKSVVNVLRKIALSESLIHEVLQGHLIEEEGAVCRILEDKVIHVELSLRAMEGAEDERLLVLYDHAVGDQQRGVR